MNDLYSNIEFTYEKETYDTLNYLDLLITRYNLNLEFNMNIKPTTVDTNQQILLVI